MIEVVVLGHVERTNPASTCDFDQDSPGRTTAPRWTARTPAWDQPRFVGLAARIAACRRPATSSRESAAAGPRSAGFESASVPVKVTLTTWSAATAKRLADGIGRAMSAEAVPVGSGRLAPTSEAAGMTTSCELCRSTSRTLAMVRPRKLSGRTTAPVAGSTSATARSKVPVPGQVTPRRRLLPQLPSLAAATVSWGAPPRVSSRIVVAAFGVPEATRTTQASVPPFKKNCWMA